MDLKVSSNDSNDGSDASSSHNDTHERAITQK